MDSHSRKRKRKRQQWSDQHKSARTESVSVVSSEEDDLRCYEITTENDEDIDVSEKPKSDDKPKSDVKPQTPTSSRPSNNECVKDYGSRIVGKKLSSVRRHIDFDHNEPMVKVDEDSGDDIKPPGIQPLNIVVDVAKPQSASVAAARTKLQQRLSSIVKDSSKQVFHRVRILPDPLAELEKKEAAAKTKVNPQKDDKNNPFGISVKDPEEISDIEYSSETEGMEILQ